MADGAYVELDRERGRRVVKTAFRPPLFLPLSAVASLLSFSLPVVRPSVLQPVECAQVPPSIPSFFSKREELETVGWSGMGWDCL